MIAKYLRSIIAILVMTIAWTQAQTPTLPTVIDWAVLAQVRYKAYQSPGMADGDKPTPGAAVQRLNGQLISIKGYVIPMDVDGNSYMLSAQPNATCFFCGKSGMESVIELWLKDGHRRFKMDEMVTFSGTLLLNDDTFGLMYI
ncbi:MAG: DUF3299 domain-containing protein, partial [Bacteroidia bacterium]